MSEKILQSYVLVEMKLTEETWFVVRNTPGVTGFIGSDSPTPVSEKKCAKFAAEWARRANVWYQLLMRVKSLTFIDGPFKGFEGAVFWNWCLKGKIKVMVYNVWSRTPVELDILQIEKNLIFYQTKKDGYWPT